MGWEGRAGGSCCPGAQALGTVGECLHAPAVCTAGPEEPVSRGRTAAGHGPGRTGGPKRLLELSAGLAVLELTGPGRDLVI